MPEYAPTYTYTSAAFTPADGITEMTSFDVQRLDGVKAPANGTDFLILKALGDKRVAKRDFDPDVGGGVDRDKLPTDDFAGKNRSFPIVEPKDVHDAATSIGRAGDDNYPPAELKANIIAIAKRKGPKFVARLPKKWRKNMAKQTIPAETVPSPSTTVPLPQQGGSDSLGNPQIDPNDLMGQTKQNCTPPPAVHPDQQAAADAQKANGEPSVNGIDPGSQTSENCPHPDSPHIAGPQKAHKAMGKKPKGKKKRHMTNPGSKPWEGKDVQLGEDTIATLKHALELAQQFTDREKTEAAHAPTATKEIDVTAEEITRILDERDAARKAAKKAGKHKAAKDAGKASKAVKKLAKLEKRLAQIENQPARPRPMLAGAASRAGDVFKGLEDQVASARTVREGMAARETLTKARMVVAENVRATTPQPVSQFGPGYTPLITNKNALPDDSSIVGISGIR